MNDFIGMTMNSAVNQAQVTTDQLNEILSQAK